MTHVRAAAHLVGSPPVRYSGLGAQSTGFPRRADAARLAPDAGPDGHPLRIEFRRTMLAPRRIPLAAAANPHGETAEARAEAASKAGAAQRCTGDQRVGSPVAALIIP